jgi:thioredoxin-dependent peroxiredoxin
MKIVALTVVAGLSVLLSARSSQAQFVDIRVGDEAPGFSLPGTDGRTHRLSDYKGKAVALFWFSHNLQYFLQKAECNSLVSAEKYIRAYDVAYFMVSVESPMMNKKFADADCGNIPVLADTTTETAKSYGVLKTIFSIGAPPPYADMWMFIIGPDGKILYIEPYQKVRSHLQTFGRDFAERLGQLGVGKAAAASSAPAPATASPSPQPVVQQSTGAPTQPTSQATEIPAIAGVWSGSGTDSSGPGEISWDIKQEGGRVAGRFKGKEPSSGLVFEGPIIGQLSSSKLTFTMTVERGTLPRPYQSCEIVLKGIADVSGIEIKGTYEGQSCGRPVRNGQLTLLRN